MKKSYVVALASFLVACGSDSSKSTTDAGSDGGTSFIDMNEPVPDMGQADEGNAGDMAEPVKDLGGPEDIGADTADSSTVDMTPPDPPIDVTWPTTPAEFASTARVTYIATLQLSELDANDDPTCCRDFGAISRDEGIDNSLAILRSSLQGFDFDLNELLTNTITSGDLVALLDHRELDGPTDPDHFVLSWLRGSFEGTTDYASAAAGTGTYLLDADSLLPNGEPKLLFNPAKMDASAMSAGPAELNLLLPIALSTLDVTVSDASIAGDATIAGDDISYVNGTMSGYVELDAIFENINLLVAERCACLGLAGELFEKDADGDWKGNCVDDPSAVCSEELCNTLAGNDLNDGGACTLTRQFLPALADIDLDGDRSRYEAISLGLEWTGVTGEVVGGD